MIAEGFLSIEAQAEALGLPRSTAWTIFRSTHKGSGLSATTINRMLASPLLPLTVRARLVEYVEEKASGVYGHTVSQLRKFCAQIAKDIFYQSQRQTQAQASAYTSLREASFGPEELARIAKAYEIAVLELQLIDRDAPIAKLVAAKVIDLARRGEHDPASISAKALEELKAR